MPGSEIAREFETIIEAVRADTYPKPAAEPDEASTSADGQRVPKGAAGAARAAANSRGRGDERSKALR